MIRLIFVLYLDQSNSYSYKFIHIMGKQEFLHHGLGGLRLKEQKCITSS